MYIFIIASTITLQTIIAQIAKEKNMIWALSDGAANAMVDNILKELSKRLNSSDLK